MAKVKVWYAERYEAETDEMRRSTRMYTLEAIAASNLLTAVEGTETEIDSEDLVPGEGWTSENYVRKHKQ